MENSPKVVTVSYNDAESDIPIIRTIKCEGNDSFDEHTRIDHHTMSILETTLDEEEEEEERSLDEVAEQRRYLSIESDLQFISVKNMVGLFKCFRCNFSCTSTKDLIRHYQFYRKREPYTCFQCGYVGANKMDFVEHSRGHFENIYYRCSKCSFRVETVSEIKRHLQEHSLEPSVKVDKFNCPLCEVALASKLSFKSHINSCKALLKDISGTNYSSVGVKEDKGQRSAPALQSSNESEENSKKVVIKEELKEENANPVYTCPHCFFIFGSKYKRSVHIYKAHFRNKENKNEKLVTIDEDKSGTENEFDPYKVGSDMNPSVQLERIYLCPVCHYVFTSVSSLNSHVITHKSVTECPICKLNCKTNFDLKEHMISSHTTKKSSSNFSCSSCDKTFVTLGKLKYHIKEVHSDGLKCPFCPRFMKSESALRVHIEAHSKVKEYYCPKCKFTAKNSTLLQYHMSKFHPNKKKFSCNVCGKAYTYKYSLQRHQMNCPGNDMGSGSKDDKDDTTHEIEIDISQKEKLSCSECKATFKEAAHLKRHLLVHFHKTPYRCMKCGLRCKTKHILSAHMKIHNMKAHYQCKECQLKFKTRYALNNHAIIHSEKRPYTCEVCGLTFKRKANYRRHYDIHSDVKPYKCPLCDFYTKRKDGLYKHLETHKSS